MARFLFSFLLFCLCSAPAAAREDTPDSTTTDDTQLSTILPSGLQVVVTSLPEAALTRIGMFYAAGSALVPDSLAGLAHLSEHLLTESSLNHPDGGLTRQQTLYCTYSNAYTGPTFIQFDSECLPEFLPKVLELEADRLRGVVTDSVSFAREKAVVLEELAMRKRLPPTSEFLYEVFRACYPGHPFGRGVGGTDTTVSRIRMQDFLDFQQRFIRPERASLVVKGPGNPESMLDEIERIFGAGPAGEPVLAEYPACPPLVADQIILDSHDHTGMMVTLTFRVQLVDRTHAAWARILPYLMWQDGMHPGVYSIPGETVFQLFSHSVYYRPSHNPHGFNPEQQSRRYMGYLWRDLADFMDDLRDPDDFDRRLTRAIDRVGSGARNPGRSRGQGTALVNGNEYLTRDTIRETLQDVGPDDFLEFMSRWFNTDQVMVGVSHGRDSERQATISLSRSMGTTPARGAESALEGLTLEDIQPVLDVYSKSDLIKVDRFTLFNGIPVYSLEIPETNSLSLAGFRSFPPIKDMAPGKKPGLVDVFNQVVNYDDKQRKDPNRSEGPRSLPFNLEFNLSWNLGKFSTHGSAGKLEKIVAAVDARVNSEDFNTIRWYSMMGWGADYLSDIRDHKTNVARAWRWEQIFGPKSPSLGEWAPDPGTFEKIKYKDLVRLQKNYVKKTRDLQLFVAGGIPADRIKTVFNRTFGMYDRRQEQKSPDDMENRLQGIHGKVVADLTRGDVRFEITFPPRTTPMAGNPAITCLTLKQALNGILTDRLREKEGLTYDVDIRVFKVPGGRLWEISVTCQPGQAPRVLELVSEELKRIRGQGFSPDDIARARLKLTGDAIRSLTDRRSGVNYLRYLAELGGVPRDVLQEISRVDAEEVNALARVVIDPDHFVFTATGPLLEEDLEKFGLP